MLGARSPGSVSCPFAPLGPIQLSLQWLGTSSEDRVAGKEWRGRLEVSPSPVLMDRTMTSHH